MALLPQGHLPFLGQDLKCALPAHLARHELEYILPPAHTGAFFFPEHLALQLRDTAAAAAACVGGEGWFRVALVRAAAGALGGALGGEAA